MRILIFLVLIGTQFSFGQVTPLLSTTWNQTCNYNELMPTVGSGGACGKAFTGCNATAMAQICKYYSYPNSGFGSYCNANNPSYCADFGSANYDYSLMPNNVSSSNIQVATLMHDLGVAVDMNWSGTNSTSFFSSSVLKEYFAYSPKMYSTATFMFSSTAELIEAIKEELDNGRPVYAKGGGHFYLIDGYNLSDQFHMNFGWSGVYDGYYAINSVVNGAGTFTPSNFIFQIEPLNGDLESAKDTIYIPAGGVSTESLEFTSLYDWTISSSESWLTPNLSSGLEGYFSYYQGSHFAAGVNNGSERVGYLIIENGFSIDSVVVIQSESPLQCNPDPINFSYIASIQNVSVDYFAAATWNVSSTEPWITLSASSGTGPGNFNVEASDNSAGLARQGYVIVQAGIYTDSILVTQDEGVSVNVDIIDNESIQVFPNPAKELLKVELNHQSQFQIIDLSGRVVLYGDLDAGVRTIELNTIESGHYLLKLESTSFHFVKL